MISGVLNINKPAGITSYDVVRAVKRGLNFRKVGHCGTLDPMAEGVLLVCFGAATKMADALSTQKKVYDAEMLLGYETDTGDIEGRMVNKREEITGKDIPSTERLKEVLDTFVGDTEQLPPMYSAVKYKGVQLYKLARKGETVERKPRKIRIYSITLEGYDFPAVRFTVECARGTYIRSLVEDAGRKLGTYATMSKLVRRSIGQFNVENSLGLNEMNAMPADKLLMAAERYSGMAGQLNGVIPK